MGGLGELLGGAAGDSDNKEVNMKRLILSVLAISAILLGACACPSAPAAPTTQTTPTAPIAPTQPKVTPKKITLADAPIVLDLSPLLPVSFEHLDAASEGMSNKDLGLGPKASEVVLFLSEEPYQMIWGFLGIIESRSEHATTDALFRDEQQVRNTIYWGLKKAPPIKVISSLNQMWRQTLPIPI